MPEPDDEGAINAFGGVDIDNREIGNELARRRRSWRDSAGDD